MNIIKTNSPGYLMAIDDKELQLLEWITGKCNGGDPVQHFLFKKLHVMLEDANVPRLQCGCPATIDFLTYPPEYPKRAPTGFKRVV